MHKVHATYKDSSGNRFIEESIIDLAALCGTDWRLEKGIHDMAQSLDIIAKATKKSTDLQQEEAWRIADQIDELSEARSPELPESEAVRLPERIGRLWRAFTQ